MIIHCKNTLGDGTVVYKDYEVEDYIPDADEEATAEDYESALEQMGVSLDA